MKAATRVSRRPRTAGLTAVLAAAAVCLTALAWAPSASAAPADEFGIESLEAEETTSQAGQAGMHPDFTTTLVMNHTVGPPGEQLNAKGVAEDVSVALPPGLAGNLNNVASCPTGQLALGTTGECPIDSQVGIVRLELGNRNKGEAFYEPLYKMQRPNPGVLARLGFLGVVTVPNYIDIRLRTGSDYGVVGTVTRAEGIEPFVTAETTIWGVPSDPVHDPQRLTPFEAIFTGCSFACLTPLGKRETGLRPPYHPFLSNPAACAGQSVEAAVTSYGLPGEVFRESATMEPIEGCESIPFEPSLQVEPTSHRAGEPTGLSAVLKIPQTNEANLPSTSPLKDSKVVLPEGMTISSAAAEGLAGCSAAQAGYSRPMSIEEEEANPPKAAECPEASKIGSATFVSPALEAPLHGQIYQRAQGEQPYLGAHSAGEASQLLGVWLVSDELGMHIKIPGVVEADPSSGRLTASFTGLPQLPLEEVDLEFKGGPRAPLRNPEACGTYATSYEMTPWSGNAPVSGESQMKIDEGCNAPGFAPKLSAGTSNPVAGAFSPFSLTLTQGPGEQNLEGLSVSMPKGVLAKLAGVQLCSGAALGAGACPSGSEVGSVTAATGPGPQPLWIPQPGKSPTAVYLAGPYKGAPYSLLVKVPAQAGPFDLGNVLTRVALNVDPRTAQVTAVSDPLPQILKGVPVQYRTVRVDVSRPGFTLNPTSCEATAVTGTASSAKGAKASLSSRFQVGECAALGFKPKLALRLFSHKSHRGAHPRLKAVLTPRKGDANAQRIATTLPPSELLENAHFKTICTRVQYNAGGGLGEKCPKGSVYGHVKAWTPLLSEPLSGPVYLRSSNHQLPDLVLVLHGQISIEAVGRIDSVKLGKGRAGIRTVFEGVPDGPLSRVVLEMQGGKKGLLVNSTDICRGKHRARVKSAGHNGRTSETSPLVQPNCGKATKKQHKKHKRK